MLTRVCWGRGDFILRQDTGKISFEALHLNDTKQEMNYDGKKHPTLPNSNLQLRMGTKAGLQEGVLPTMGTQMEKKHVGEHLLPSHLITGYTLYCGFLGRQAPLTTHP